MAAPILFLYMMDTLYYKASSAEWFIQNVRLFYDLNNKYTKVTGHFHIRAKGTLLKSVCQGRIQGVPYRSGPPPPFFFLNTPKLQKEGGNVVRAVNPLLVWSYICIVA